ncbi:VOC family protein [Cytophagaceae bacterium ABcell3]|nr:VOC family protein [Cytophagaceae bacterium ABcell3]
MMIKRIKETCLYVDNLDRTQAFYQEKLGLKLINRSGNRHVFFRAGESVLLCFNPEETKNDQELPPHAGYGTLHLAFEVSVDEYNDWKQKVESANIEVLQETSWRNDLKSFYFHDPDGHLLEIVMEGIWG